MGNELGRRSFGSSSDCIMPHFMNNMSALRFHSVHGENIRLSDCDRVATREGGFCKAIVFSHRPVSINEYIYIKFLDVQTCWSGSLRIGFTANDPVVYRNKLPKYACPCMTEMPGNWARALSERYAVTDSILFYYVDASGDVHYGINNEERGVFFGGVGTSGRLWAMLDIYGNSVKIQFVDPCQLRNLGVRNQERVPETGSILLPTRPAEPLPSINLQPMSFHPVHGKDVLVERNRATVRNMLRANICGYVFIEHSFTLHQYIVIKVLECSQANENGVIFGVTSCNPAAVSAEAFPNDPDELLDRSEYWVLYRYEERLQAGDIIAFVLESDGALKCSKNGDTLTCMMYVDCSLNLWFFINLGSSLLQIQLEGTYMRGDLEDITPYIRSLCQNPTLSTSVLHNAANSIAAHESQTAASKECVICCEASVNCALYRCGHACMCYDCALLVKKKDAQCPLCRGTILDVLQIFT